MAYSIVPTLESDVYVAIEGNPHHFFLNLISGRRDSEREEVDYPHNFRCDFRRELWHRCSRERVRAALL